MKPTKRRIRFGYLSTEQLDRLFRACTPRDRLLFRLIYLYGLRASEGGAIRIDAIDKRRGTLGIERVKGSVSREYPLLPQLVDDLAKWLKWREPKDSPWLFPQARTPNAPMPGREVRRAFKRAAQEARLPAELQHPHVLKHSIATHMIDRGVDIRTVQEWLGHTRIDNTLIYAEVSDRSAQLAINTAAQLGELGQGALVGAR